jgi:predicted DNA-binding transcriptional regulator YafY
MGYMYKRKNPVKLALAQAKIDAKRTFSSCPSCQGELEFVEEKTDRQTYLCKKCNSFHTFTTAPTPEKKSKITKGASFTVRDKSKEKKQTKPVDTPDKPQAPSNNDKLGIIRSALADSKVIRLKYESEKNEPRIIEPYKLTKNANGEILLYGYDTNKEGIRTFKLDKIVDVYQEEFDYKPRWEAIDETIKTSNDRKEDNSKDNVR